MDNTNVLQAPAPERRIHTIDIVRGIAIIGTLGTNVWVFSHPWGLIGMLSSPVLPGASDAAAVAQLLLMTLTQGKFLALLTLVFGMGLAMQHDAAARTGQRWPGRYLRRSALLLLDGIVNYILIAEFDVLMGYAVTGAVVAFLLVRSPRAQRGMIITFAALHVALISAIVLLVATTSSPDRAPTLPDGPNPYADASFLGLALFRLDNAVIFRAEVVLVGFLTLAMFLIGARLLRAGVFTAEGGRLRSRLILAGAIAAPIDVILGAAGGTAGLLAERYLVAPVVALGILGLVAEVCVRRGTDGWFARRMRTLGRVALSAYILQNLLAGALFYGWGLGLAEAAVEVRLPVTIAAFVAIVVLLVAGSHLWLRRFRLGPVEWLWKWAAGPSETADARSLSTASTHRRDAGSNPG